MSPPLHCPYGSLSAGVSVRAADCSKMSGSCLHQLQQAKLLAAVDESCEPVDKSHAQNSTTPAMPSSVNCAICYNQRSAKKLLKQAVIPVATVTMTQITKLSPIVEQVMVGEYVMRPGRDTNEGEESINTEVEVEDMVVDPAASKNSAEVADSTAASD
jgi:hypothetical protein